MASQKAGHGLLKSASESGGCDNGIESFPIVEQLTVGKESVVVNCEPACGGQRTLSRWTLNYNLVERRDGVPLNDPALNFVSANYLHQAASEFEELIGVMHSDEWSD